jgi:hypothetical protein
MIEVRRNEVKASMPPVYMFDWKCNCGHQVFSRKERGQDFSRLDFERRWKMVNPDDSVILEERTIDGSKIGEIEIKDEEVKVFNIFGDLKGYNYNIDALSALDMNVHPSMKVLRDCLVLLLDACDIQIRRSDEGLVVPRQEELFQKLLSDGFILKGGTLSPAMCVQVPKYDPCPQGMTNYYICRHDSKPCPGIDNCEKNRGNEDV